MKLEVPLKCPPAIQKMLNNFNAMQAYRQIYGNTYIDRKFTEDMK